MNTPQKKRFTISFHFFLLLSLACMDVKNIIGEELVWWSKKNMVDYHWRILLLQFYALKITFYAQNPLLSIVSALISRIIAFLAINLRFLSQNLINPNWKISTRRSVSFYDSRSLKIFSRHQVAHAPRIGMKIFPPNERTYRLCLFDFFPSIFEWNFPYY